MSSVRDPLILACVRPSPDKDSKAVAQALSTVRCGYGSRNSPGGTGVEGEVRGDVEVDGATVKVFDRVFCVKAADLLFGECLEPIRGEPHQ
jgi:hypothetical protein